MFRISSLLIILVACSKGSNAPATGSAGSAAAAKPIGSAAASTPTPTPTADVKKGELPAGRDAEAEKLVKAGGACEVKDDDISLNCKESQAASEYAAGKETSVEVGATCAALVRDPNLAVKKVAMRCLERLGSEALTPVLAYTLDSIEAEQNKKLREQIAWSMRSADAGSAKVDDRVIAMMDKLVQADEEEAAGSLLSTLFPIYAAATGKQPAKGAQEYVFKALARKKGTMFRRAADKARLLEDKPAACKALATAATPEAGTDWMSAVQAINQVSECQDVAGGVLEKIIADDKWINENPDELRKLVQKFELTPELRKSATDAFTKAKKDASDSNKKLLDEALAELAKKK